MPIYEYRCEQGHTFEVIRRMSDDPVTACTTCEAAVERVFHPVAVHFKGSGFYNTDYGKRRRGGNESSEGEGKSSDSDSKSGSDTKAKTAESSGSTGTGSNSSSSSSGSAGSSTD